MAIYHYNRKVGKNPIQSALAKVSYILRIAKYTAANAADEVIYYESNLPEWAKLAVGDDRRVETIFWTAADIHERKNARLFVSEIFALPIEFSLNEKIKAAQEMAAFLSENGKYPYTLAIHDGRGKNPHCHLMLNEREINDYSISGEDFFSRYNNKKQTGSKKTRKFMRRENLLETRKKWEEIANNFLKKKT